MLRRESDGSFSLHVISFLTVAIILTLFSLAYGNWYYAQITGLAPVGSYDPPIEPSMEDSSPPQAVINQVSQTAQSISQSASHASSIGSIINSQQTISESELSRYLGTLTTARDNSLRSYKVSSGDASKYSSNLLDKYQESMIKDISSIEKEINHINSLLKETVNERFENQRKEANWKLQHESEIKDSIEGLEEYMGSLPDVNQGEIQSIFNIALENPPKLIIPRGSSENAEIGLTNLGDESIHNCRLSITGIGSEWISFPQGNFILLLEPRQTESFSFDLDVPNEALGNTYFLNFQVACTEGAATGLTYHFVVPFSYQELLERFYNNHVLPNLDYEVYPEYGLNQICYSDLQLCYEEEISCPNYMLSCINEIDLDNGCTEFYDLCVYNEISISYTAEEYDGFLQAYYNPYESQFTWECENDVAACVDPENCPYYIASCVADHEPGNPASPTCLSFLNECSEGFYPSYSEMRIEFIETLTPYYNMPSSCLESVASSSDPNICLSNSPDVYTCIISQEYGSALGGSCSSFSSSCLNSPGTQQGTLSSGSISSGSTATHPTSIVISSTQSTYGRVQSICQGDQSCLSLANICLTPLYPIAVDIGFVNFGDYGYNAVTMESCEFPPINLYIRPPKLDINIVQNPSTGNTGESNPLVIHFQTNEGSSSNYVAVMLSNFNGFLTLNFLSSPDFNDLEEKISQLIQQLLYGESSSSYITGMSLQQAEEIVNQSTSIPWVLWIILFVMVICFVLFGNNLAPYNERLISSGKKALNRKDYALAIQNYNEIARIYPTDYNVKQEALDYLLLLKTKIGSGKINLEFDDKNSLPKIKSREWE